MEGSSRKTITLRSKTITKTESNKIVCRLSKAPRDSIRIVHAVTMPMLAPENEQSCSRSMSVEDWLSSMIIQLLRLRRKGLLSAQEIGDQTLELMKTYGALQSKSNTNAITTRAHTPTNTHSNSATLFMHDSGSNAYLTDSVETLLPNTIRACNVSVYGIDGKGTVHPIHASVCGDVLYHLNDDVSVTLKGVLVVKDAAIGPTDADQRQRSVLVSTSLLVSECGVGVHFVEGGERVEILRGGEVVRSFHTTPQDEGLFLDRVDIRKTKISRLETEKDLSSRKIQNRDSNLDDLQSDRLNLEKEKDDLDSCEINTDRNALKSTLTKDTDKRATVSLDEHEHEHGAPPAQKQDRVQKAPGILPKKLRERRRLEKILHGRIHFGNTQHIIKLLRQAYDDNDLFNDSAFDDLPCDACAFAKARLKAVEKTSSRKATRVGGRLHYDVFSVPWRSDTGKKYFLLVVDEYSSYVWAFGIRKKSEVMRVLKDLIVRLERFLSKKVESVYRSNGDSIIDSGVASIRCDNAGENVLAEMVEWCRKRGTHLETTIAHTPHQNGRAERVGGVVWKGAAALRYAANLPDEYWLYCVLAYIHMRNRLPNTSDRLGKRTPYEDMHDIDITPRKLIGHFRTIGSLCYVVRPPNETRAGKPKLAYKAMMLGYADADGKKGYMVQRVDDGVVMYVPYERLHKCHENIMIYPPLDTQESYIRNKIAKRNRDKYKHSMNNNHNHYDINIDDSSDSEDSDSDNNNMNDEPNNSEMTRGIDRSGGSSGLGDVLEDTDAMLGLESQSSPRPVTRSQARSQQQPQHIHTHQHEHTTQHEHSSLVLPRARSLSPVGQVTEDQPTEEEDASAQGTNNDDDIVYVVDDVKDDEYEVAGIESYRRVGNKRNGIEYLTEWIGGPPTWEPASTFRLDEPDEETGSSYLPVYDEFRQKMKNNEVEEFREVEESYFNSGESDRDLELKHDIVRDTVRKEAKEEEVDLDELRDSLLPDQRAIVSLVRKGIEVPGTRKQAQKRKDWKEFAAAELTELQAFAKHKVWELVSPSPEIENVVGTRWVYDIKLGKKNRIVKHKARLVAQGYSQVEGVDYNDTFAPTMHIKTLRVLLALASKHKYDVQQYDVSTAFLHASLEEVVYVRQPPGHEVEGKEDWVYKLDKAMYGLKNAPKAYSDHFMSVVRELGFVQSYKDECLWMLCKGTSFMHILFHVDDIIAVSNDDSLREDIETRLKTRLDLKCEGEPEMFLGVAIERESDGTYVLDQKTYIENMADRFGVVDSKKQVEQPCVYGEKLTKEQLPKTEEEEREAKKLPFQALVGSLIYVSKTRPDVAYAISNVARFMSCWGVVHFKAALRILTYLYQTRDMKHVIKSSDNDIILHAYVDANWKDERESANENEDVKWKSQYGYLLYLDNVLVSWVSKRASSRAHSSMEAEYYAADECVKEVIWFRALLDELGHTQHKPTIIHEDNDACISFSKNNTCHARTKHIDLRAYCLRDYVFDNICALVHVDTIFQLADGLTKAQLKNVFTSHVSKMFSGADSWPPTSSIRKSKKKSKPWFKRKTKKSARTRAECGDNAAAALELVKRIALLKKAQRSG